MGSFSRPYTPLVYSTSATVIARLKPFNVMANTIEDEVQISKNVRDGVAAQALGFE